jgi:hypothetical protein
MKKNKTAAWKTLIVLALFPAALSASWFSNEDSTEPLYRAHESFLRKDMRSVALNLKELFQDTRADETEKKNGLALLEKAYAYRNGSGIPVDWRLPVEITKLKATVIYFRKPHEENYGFKVAGTAVALGTVKQLKVTRYPDQVVLDKQAKVGEWEEEVDPDDGPSFELDGPHSVKPVEEGLYLVHMELANGNNFDAWFILSNMASTDTPVVRTPCVGETFTTRNPTFKWEDFKSPEYQGHESRSIWMTAVKAEPPGFDWIQAWTMYEGDPIRTQATIGLEKDGVGVKQLENGRYNFYLGYKEQRRFGELRLGRQSFTVTPFHIKAK